jgi:AraC-like DNA-binding protein
MRLRRAAMRLVQEESSVLEIAFECGFGDLSNFNRSFRAEFGMSPRAFRRGGATRRPPSERGDVSVGGHANSIREQIGPS